MLAKLIVALLGAASAVIGCVPALAADRVRVAIACKPGGEKFAYDCTFKLTSVRTGVALDNAGVVIGADMPSMPMAHNVPSVNATPTGTAGEYAARLTLEMYGDWALRVRISGPIRDQIVELKNFNAQGSGPPSMRAGPKATYHKH
jgi:YtkA-like